MPTMTMNDGCDIHYRFDGDDGRPVLVFSNPHGFTHRVWDPQVAAMASRFRILRYDNRGHGLSGAPPGPYPLERVAMDARELIEGLALREVAFCGLSIGGMVGIWLAANAPHLLRRAVLANTSAYLDQPDGALKRRTVVIEKGGMGAATGDIIERSLSREFRDANPDKTEELSAMIAAMAPEPYLAGAAGLLDMDLRDSLSCINVPVLVITGSRDTATIPAMGQAVAEGIAGSCLAVLDCAHLSNIEQAGAFNSLLGGFLEER